MNTQLDQTRIDEAKAAMAGTQAEISKLNRTIMQQAKDVFDAEWVKVTWDDLEKYLIAHPQETPFNNLVVTNVPYTLAHTSYCRVDKNNELVIGAWYYNEKFPRGLDLYVRRDLTTYADYRTKR